MAVMARKAWTDQRLDDLNARVDRIERRMDEGFAEMRAQFAAQNRMLIQLFGGMFAIMLIGLLGVIVTQA
jgi:roadblock/LC7 domain-containing protein